MDETGFHGGRGSCLAVTAQNPGTDGVWQTADDILTPMNFEPADVSVDWIPDDNPSDPLDRVRGFYSKHPQGSVFAFGDASCRFVRETIDHHVYRQLSTRVGGEVVSFD